ncbi:helix-turn-helix domain-containing protein [Candidatus Woesearchaeota archaeon]|nr:helix-turn-helix domain-containing protein [Candidatus Woesearchaeota archaeon]
MKVLKVGVYHHDCWGSFSTKNYPSLSMTELGAVHIVKKDQKGVLIDCFWRMTADTPEEVTQYLEYVKTLPHIKKLKIYFQRGNEAYAFIQFLSRTSSYDSVLKTNAVPIGPIVQEKELEIHTVATEKPKQTAKLLSELEALGEVKVFKIADFSEENVLENLTLKQQNALIQALHNNYYTWPRKTTLNELSKKLGVKRRTFQEHLRLAEAKVIPFAIEKLMKERKI